MIKKIALCLSLLWFASISFSQFNDTITYKSGFEKVVEISEFTAYQITYTYVNQKGDTTESITGMGVVKYFKIYDDDNILSYDSDQVGEITDKRLTKVDFTDQVSVSKHTISVNPFFIPFLSLNVKHNYNFGKKMRFAITSRFTYLSPIIEDYDIYGNFITAGAGIKLNPFFNDKFAFGVDLSPMIGFTTSGLNYTSILIPVNLNLDFYLNKQFGISFDFGLGGVYGKYNSNRYLIRGHFGIMWQFKNKVTFETNH